MATYPSPTLQDLTLQGTASIATVTSADATITGGTVDGTVIGGTTPAAVSATNLMATGTATLAGVSATSLVLPSQTANEFYASPSGSAGAPSFRAMTATDVPELTATQMPAFTGDATSAAGSTALTLAASGVTAGTYGSASSTLTATVDAKGRITALTTNALASGSVSSVGLAAPSIFAVTGTPVTSAGTLTLALASQAANTVFASPSGAAGGPSFRSLVLGDLPSGVALLSGATFTGTINANASNAVQATWPVATGTIANGGTGAYYGLVSQANNNGGSAATSCAAMTFIRGNVFGAFFGIDTDNNFKVGGWSFGNAAYRILHEGLATWSGVTNITTTGTISASNFDTQIAPSLLAIGTSPWTYQNTNAYGVFVYFTGVTAIGTTLQISKDNSTYYSIGDAGNMQCYLPAGWYFKLTYSTAPSDDPVIVPI
jgi:hypothetical protein